MEIFYRMPDNDVALRDLEHGVTRCQRKGGTESDVDTIKKMIIDRKAYWLCTADLDGNVIVTLEKIDDQLAMFIWLCWGKNLSQWYQPMRQYVTKFAQHYGATKFRMGSPRKAWRLLLPNSRLNNGFFEEDIDYGHQ
jgi:hypothetical protein